MNDLETRLSAQLRERAAMARPDDRLADVLDGDGSYTNRTAEPERARRGRGRVLVFVGAAAAVGLGVVGVAGIANRGGVDSTPDAADTVVTAPAPTPVSSLPGSTVLDRLAVVNGASDFYAGSTDLGEPAVAAEYFDSLVRCARLTADGTACEKLEGVAGVPLVSHEPEAVAIDTVARNVGSYSVRVGTTFTEISPAEYAGVWTSDVAGPVQDGTEVRGHPATRFEHEGSPAVVWHERPGVLVWVVVPPEQEDDLLVVAEGVRRVDGPTTIPDVVVVTPLAAPWDAGNNNADGLVVVRAGGTECVGLDYVDGTCGGSIAQRTIVRHQSDPEATLVAGSTPAGVTAVRIETSDGDTASVETVPFVGSASRFYSTSIARADTITVRWLDAAGTEVDHLSFTPVRPDAS